MFSRATVVVWLLTAGPAVAAPRVEGPRVESDVSVADRPAANAEPRRTARVVGGAMLGGAGLMLGLFGAFGYSYAENLRSLRGLLADIQARGYRTPADDLFLGIYDDMLDVDRNAMIGVGITAGVIAGVGAGLLTWGLVRERGARARVRPVGGPQWAGLTLSGRF